MRILVVTTACLVFLGLAPGSSLGQTSADSGSVKAFYGEWFGSIPKGPDAYARFYAVDGMILPPNLPAIQGRPGIAAWLAKSQVDATYTTRPTGLSVDEIRFLSPDLVIHRTTLTGERIPKVGPPGVPFETKYLDLLRRTNAGRWEVVYRMWSDSR
jgi:ketosteroid isomerase-like protein